MVKLPQKIVAVVGKTSRTLFKNAGEVEVISCPAEIRWIRSEKQENGIVLSFEGISKGRGTVCICADGRNFKIQCAVFEQKEFFLSMVISSNYHVGLDPENCIRGCEREELHNVAGHGFFKTCRTLEPVYHKHQVPVTWLIDSKVAQDGKKELESFHEKYGDDYGFMPSSYFHHNPRNYNLQKSEEEVYEFVRKGLSELESCFDSYSNLIGVDQWVGSVGSRFVKAAERLGLHGIWGMGFDHYTCDSSMFHRGCPWDAYKPDRDNIKIPCRYPSSLWAFQWTTRDIINSVHTPEGKSSGSVIFSTDPDDIRSMGIMENQENYFEKMLRNYKKSMQDSKFFVFLVHQEDHESHIAQDNEYLDHFLQQVSGEVTFATLYEIAEWLNIVYTPEENACQALYVEDPLECPDQVRWQRKGICKPENWGHFMPHCAFYDNMCQVLAEKPSRTPLRVFDYGKNYPIKEVDSYPEESYGTVELISEKYEDGVYTAVIHSESEETGFPLVVWEAPWEKCVDTNYKVVVTDHYTLLFLPLKSGENRIVCRFEGEKKHFGNI